MSDEVQVRLRETGSTVSGETYSACFRGHLTFRGIISSSYFRGLTARYHAIVQWVVCCCRHTGDLGRNTRLRRMMYRMSMLDDVVAGMTSFFSDPRWTRVADSSPKHIRYTTTFLWD